MPSALRPVRRWQRVLPTAANSQVRLRGGEGGRAGLRAGRVAAKQLLGGDAVDPEGSVGAQLMSFSVAARAGVTPCGGLSSAACCRGTPAVARPVARPVGSSSLASRFGPRWAAVPTVRRPACPAPARRSARPGPAGHRRARSTAEPSTPGSHPADRVSPPGSDGGRRPGGRRAGIRGAAGPAGDGRPGVGPDRSHWFRRAADPHRPAAQALRAGPRPGRPLPGRKPAATGEGRRRCRGGGRRGRFSGRPKSWAPIRTPCGSPGSARLGATSGTATGSRPPNSRPAACPEPRVVRNPGPGGARRSARTTGRCVTRARSTRSGPSLRAAPSARCRRWSPGRRAGRARRSRGPVRSPRPASPCRPARRRRRGRRSGRRRR